MSLALEGVALIGGRRLRVEVAGDRIDRVEDLGSGTGEGPWLAPGLVDLQVNGCAGFDFNAPELAPDVVAGATRRSPPSGARRARSSNAVPRRVWSSPSATRPPSRNRFARP